MAIVNDKTPGPAKPKPVRSPIRRLSARAAAPLYEGVKRQISEAILLGKWTPGTVLPGEVALAQLFGVAVGTVRRALTGAESGPELWTVFAALPRDETLRRVDAAL